ncbi:MULTISPECIES: hypothetical protein [Williamsia]|uniref:DNA-directed RNA polymerase specialized sigma24 family protein n=1 Tax=Williamsia limnetica TaxID=882452 RepID=A0A318RCV7_WILLI|nr:MULTISPECIES: hypothetical protein [Williamsia]ORM37538.1 hypothetical protein BFL43_03855 [Williamsia sp. 1135]PYE11161.1 hypothetical protein DFR67_1365 [Williamsia limnetica]
MPHEGCDFKQEQFQHWLDRVRDTHDAVRFTVGHRLHGDWERAEAVSIEVIVRMLTKPKVFRYQGLPYSGRIGSVAESILAAPATDTPPELPDWLTLTSYLEQMSPQLRPVLVGAFVDGLDDEHISAEVGLPTAIVLTMRKEVEKYLAQSADAGT